MPPNFPISRWSFSTASALVTSSSCISICPGACSLNFSSNIDFLAVEESQISVSFLEQAGRAWMPVYVWTVDDYDKMRNYLDMGVSGLITNYPDLARAEVDAYKERYPQYYEFEGSGYPVYDWEE